MKKTAAALLMCLTVGILSGCGAVQVNERMFVQMMGLSEKRGIYELTVQVNGGGSGERSEASPSSDYRLLTGRGRSFSEAAESISRKNGKELFFGHCQAIFTDESILSDPERIKNLLGNRISAGCTVIYSSDPANLAASDDDGELTGADAVAMILKRYTDDGILSVSTLKTACEAAESGGSTVMPNCGSGFDGSAVMSGGKTAFLDLTESAAYNLLNGGKNVTLSVLGGRAELHDVKHSIYYRTSDNGGEYQINFTADCTVSELGYTSDLSEYRRETVKLLTEAEESFLRRAYSEEFLSAVKELENVRYGNENIGFSVSADIKIK